MWRTKKKGNTKYEQVEPYWQITYVVTQHPYMTDVSRYAANKGSGINRNANRTIPPEHGYKFVIS